MRSAPAPRRGTIVPLVAVTIVILVMFVALAVDVGLMALARVQAQSAADVAALTGTRMLDGNPGSQNNLANAVTAAKTSGNKNKIMSVTVPTANLSVKTTVYKYDTTAQAFKVDNTAWTTSTSATAPNSQSWTVMNVRYDGTSPTYFGRIFNVAQYNVAAEARAVHRPRDIALILDFSGSMQFGSVSHFPDSGDVSGVLSGDPAYPKFGHWQPMSTRATTGANPLCRTTAYTMGSGELNASNNYTLETAGGPPVIRDFSTKTGSGAFNNAFHNPAGSQASWSPNVVASPANFAASYVTTMPAPDNFADQSDSPRAYVGDKWPQKSGGSGSANPAATVMEYLTGSNTAHPTKVDATNGNTYLQKNIDTKLTWEATGYGATFQGSAMGPGYYGKTFYVWPPDPRDPVGLPNATPVAGGATSGDWRKRFFVTAGSTGTATPNATNWMDDNSRLFDTGGVLQQPGSTTYAINYAAILAWLKSGPTVLPPDLRSGRVVYYTSIPDDVPATGGTLDQVFWREYIKYVLGVDTTNRGKRTLAGREPAWGTIKITPKADLLKDQNGKSTRPTATNPPPYMHYNDNPMRPRMNFWFGPLTMLFFLSEDNDGNPNMRPGTCHESQCWQLKAGMQSAIDDIRLNHPNDFICSCYFSTIAGFKTPRVKLGGSEATYTKAKNALWYPFSLLDNLTDTNASITPYNTSWGYTAAGDIPNANGGTCPETAFKTAYNEFSCATGYNGRRGATKLVVFETDGVPNAYTGGSLNNAGANFSYYTGDWGTGVSVGNNSSSATDPAVQAVATICAMPDGSNAAAAADSAGGAVAPEGPGYSTARSPARTHVIGFGDLFQANAPGATDAKTFLLRVQKVGNTSGQGDSAIEPYKIIIGTADERIDNMRQAMERIMQSGVQVTLINVQTGYGP